MITRTRTIGGEVVVEVEVGVGLTVTSDVEGKEIIVVEAGAEAQALITETVVEVDTVMIAEVEAGLMTGSTCPFFISCQSNSASCFIYVDIGIYCAFSEIVNGWFMGKKCLPCSTKP